MVELDYEYKDPARFVLKELESILDLIWIEEQLLSSLQNNKPTPKMLEEYFFVLDSNL